MKIDLTDLMNQTLEDAVYPWVEEQLAETRTKMDDRAWAVAKRLVRKRLELLKVHLILESPEGERVEVKG